MVDKRSACGNYRGSGANDEDDGANGNGKDNVFRNH